jgi:hypothetical protein
MKLTRLLLLLFASIMVMSCSNDDENELEKTTDDLIHTSWEGECIEPHPDGSEFRRKVVMQFLYANQGKYIEYNENGSPMSRPTEISYKFNGPVISFAGNLTGQWTITHKTKNHMTLEAYFPNKKILELKKMF